MAKRLDFHGKRLDAKSVARLLRALERYGDVNVRNVGKGDGLLLLKLGAALQRKYQRDWRNRAISDEEWAMLRRAAQTKYKAT